MKKDEVGIINLDSQKGPGTHWVAYRNGDKYAECFDSVGLIMLFEIANYSSTNGKPMIYTSGEMQERDSVLCGYWIPFIMQNLTWMMSVNHRFKIDYFKNLSKLMI